MSGAGLLLSGGFLRGAFQVGVIEALHARGLRFDVVVGVSKEALAIGLVSRLLEPTALLDAVRELARSIAALPPGLAEATKRRFVAHQPRLFEPAS